MVCARKTAGWCRLQLGDICIKSCEPADCSALTMKNINRNDILAFYAAHLLKKVHFKDAPRTKVSSASIISSTLLRLCKTSGVRRSGVRCTIFVFHLCKLFDFLFGFSIFHVFVRQHYINNNYTGTIRGMLGFHSLGIRLPYYNMFYFTTKL